MSERIYISGPISSGPAGDDHGKAAFESAIADLKELGYTDDQIVSPRARDKGDITDKIMLRASLIEQLGCDKAVFLEGWAFSYGAALEMMVALSTGMPVYRMESHRPWKIYKMDRRNSLVAAVNRLGNIPDDRLSAEDRV